ncbi:MAG: maleylacetoacetate isomerase [Alphaproteobacteria bacterium]
MPLTLHTYFYSSAAYRVRIALNLKGIAYQAVTHDLRRKAHHDDAFLRLNPQGLVPALVDGGEVITQSLAIIEYLEETHPEPTLLPADPPGRARVRAIAQAIACDIHPLNNLRVLRYLVHEAGLSDAAKDAWYAHWVALGFEAIETMLAGDPRTGRFCHGDAPGLADCCLVPQVANARRFKLPLDAYPTILRIDEAARALPAFAAAAPEAQADYSP